MPDSVHVSQKVRQFNPPTEENGMTDREMGRVTQSATVKVGAPFAKKTLAEWLEVVPDNAAIDVSVREGGSQRDPYPVAYVLTAKWLAGTT